MDERSWIVPVDRAIMSVWHADLSALPVSTLVISGRGCGRTDVPLWF